MTTATCHCGKVKIDLPKAPLTATDCNCSICRRLGVLWVYYDPAEVRMAGEEETARYLRENATLSFHHCKICGCTTHWRSLDPAARRMGINARLIEPHLLHAVPIRKFDGAESWRYLD